MGFIRLIDKIRHHFSMSGMAPVFRVQTDSHRLALENVGWTAKDVVIDVGAPLAVSLQLMISADVLIVSPSSLSYAAALIGNQTVFAFKCWPRYHYMPVWTVLPCK